MVTSHCGNLKLCKEESRSKGHRKFRICFPVFQYFRNQHYIKKWTNFKQTHTICSFTRNIAWYWTAIQSISMKIFKIHQTVVPQYDHRIPHIMSLRTYKFTVVQKLQEHDMRWGYSFVNCSVKQCVGVKSFCYNFLQMIHGFTQTDFKTLKIPVIGWQIIPELYMQEC